MLVQGLTSFGSLGFLLSTGSSEGPFTHLGHPPLVIGLDWAGWLRYTVDVLDVFSAFGYYIIDKNVDSYDLGRSP